MGLLTSACDYFHKLREIFFSFPWRHRKLLKDKAEGFWRFFLFSKRNIYLFESAARRLQVIQMPLQGTCLQAKVIELCVWLPSSIPTWMLDRKNRKRTTWEMRKLFNLNGIPHPHEFLGKIPQSIHLGCWLSLRTSLLADVIGVLRAINLCVNVRPRSTSCPAKTTTIEIYTRVGLCKWVGSWRLLQPGGWLVGCFNENGIFISRHGLSWLPFRGRLLAGQLYSRYRIRWVVKGNLFSLSYTRQKWNIQNPPA